MVAPTTRPYISAPMTRRFTRLAWTAATFTYLLIILGAIVRITGSGLGCGEHWPLCNGKLLPPLDLPTMIEYGHRLAAAAVSGLVTALAAYAWWLRQGAGSPKGVPDGPGERFSPDRTGYVWWWALRSKKRGAWYAVALVTVQVAVAAAMVLLALPPLLQAATWRWARPCGEGWSWQYFEPSGRPPVRPSDQDQLVLWMG